MIERYFQKQFNEISVDPVLRVYGFFVSGLVVLTSIHWIYFHLQSWLIKGVEAICWPMFNHCTTARILGPVQLQVVFYAMGLLGLAAAFLFLKPRWIKFAWILLIVTNLAKYSVILLDYRMRLNQHIMAFWITLAFLFLPNKKKSLKILVILFYFWAGVIKIDPEWLSGSALYIRPWFVTDELLPWACSYVVILEVLLIWSLMWSRSWMAWITFAQLVIFHIFSFKVVGFFYPTIMSAIISIFPICWYLDRKNPSLIEEFRLEKKIPYAVLLLTVVFSFFQILPKTFPGDTSVTGEGRLLALHMFDAFNSCNVRASIRMKEGMIMKQDLYLPLAPRIRCDPVVYLSRARDICYRNRDNKHLAGVDLFLETKRATDENYQTVVDIHDFCNQPIEYSLFSTNDWIQKK